VVAAVTKDDSLVSVDRRVDDGIASHAFVFRSLLVAEEARRDFERTIRQIG
jgi:hypothetical protein